MISPAENVTGAKVIVNIKPPFKAALGVPVYANADGTFEYDLQCDDPYSSFPQNNRTQ
jgi:hypothetical protein